MQDRKHYLDNIRWITVVLVIVYHIIYMFNCSGVITNIPIQGIPILDTFCAFVYPWFMCLLFVISGMSTKYSLEKRTNKEFIKDRAKRILLPSIVGMFAYGWICGVITNQFTDIFMGNGDQIPGIIKYFIYCLIGIGPLWFAHVLFVASLLIVFIRKIDKKDILSKLGEKIKLWMLIPMAFLVWGSSFILNMPMITVYRFGIYLLMFLFGYYIFSNEIIQEMLKRYSIFLIVVSTIMGIIYSYLYYGNNYADINVLKHWFTNLYLWFAIIAILSFGKKYLDFNNKFTTYMTKNNFSFYVLHYEVELLLGYAVITYMKVPFAMNYIIILLCTIIVLPLLIEKIKRIPIVNRLILGINYKI